jgi:LysR family transcriptional regulator, nitrogen assimilation regulatory protein
MDLKQIRAFLAVYEEGSFSKAAERENCTQPGLSVQIRRLEESFKQRLFERNARGVTPTVAGREFYGSCRKVVSALREAKQHMLDISGSITGSINVGLPPSFCKAALTPALRTFVEAYPHVEVRLVEAYSGSLTEWVVNTDLNFAIVTEPPAKFGLEITRIFRDRLMIVRRPNGPASRKGHSSRKQTKSTALKLVVPSMRHSLRRLIENGVEHGQVEKVMEIDGLLATLDFVRNSDWVTILPLIAVVGEVMQGKLMARPLVQPTPHLDYFLIHKKEDALSPAASAFLDLLVAEVNRASGQSSKPLRLDPRRNAGSEM